MQYNLRGNAKHFSLLPLCLFSILFCRPHTWGERLRRQLRRRADWPSNPCVSMSFCWACLRRTHNQSTVTTVFRHDRCVAHIQQKTHSQNASAQSTKRNAEAHVTGRFVLTQLWSRFNTCAPRQHAQRKKYATVHARTTHTVNGAVGANMARLPRKKTYLAYPERNAPVASSVLGWQGEIGFHVRVMLRPAAQGTLLKCYTIHYVCYVCSRILKSLIQFRDNCGEFVRGRFVTQFGAFARSTVRMDAW